MRFLFRRRIHVGIEIGTTQLRVAWLEVRGNSQWLLGFEGVDIPAGWFEAGGRNNLAELGILLAALVRDRGLVGSCTSLSIPGSQVYMRRFTMPQLRPRELKQAAYFKAFEFMPLPVEDTAFDIVPLRYYQDSTGKRVDLLFAAARKNLIDQLQSLCLSAGLKPTFIEIDSLALYRAWGGDRSQGVLLLHLHENEPSLTIFSLGAPVFHSSLAPATSWAGLIDYPDGGLPSDIHHFAHQDRIDFRTTELVGQIQGAVADFRGRQTSQKFDLEVVALAGTANVGALATGLRGGLKIPIEMVGRQAIKRLNFPEGLGDAEKLALQRDFPLALGLAMRR